MRNLTTCELDKRRHLVTDVRTSKPYLGQYVKVYAKYLGQRPIKVKRSKCQRSGMNARLPLLPVTGHPMTALSNVLIFDLLTLTLALLTCHHDNHHHTHRNEMSMLGHAPFLNQPIRGLDSWQVMINRFALSCLCIELDRTRNVRGHATLYTTDAIA